MSRERVTSRAPRFGTASPLSLHTRCLAAPERPVASRHNRCSTHDATTIALVSRSSPSNARVFLDASRSRRVADAVHVRCRVMRVKQRDTARHVHRAALVENALRVARFTLWCASSKKSSPAYPLDVRHATSSPRRNADRFREFASNWVGGEDIEVWPQQRMAFASTAMLMVGKGFPAAHRAGPGDEKHVRRQPLTVE